MQKPANHNASPPAPKPPRSVMLEAIAWAFAQPVPSDEAKDQKASA